MCVRCADKLKKITTIVIFLTLIKTVFAAVNVDSLKTSLNAQKANSLQKCRVLNLLGLHYESTSDYNQALLYLYQSKKIADAADYINERIELYNLIGYVYWHMSDYDSSFHYHQKSLRLIDSNDTSPALRSFTYLMLGNDYYDTGEFDKSSEYYFKSLREAEKSDDVSWQIKAHNRLSKLCYKLNDFPLSKIHAQKAVGLNTQNDHRDLGDSYNTFGNIYKQGGKQDSALHYFHKTYYHFNKSGDVIGQAIAKINLGDTYFELANATKNTAYLDSSYENYKQSYKLNSKVGNKFGMIYGLWGMADVSVNRSNDKDILLNYRKALSISHEIGAKSEICRLYFKIHHVYEADEQKDSSLHYLKKYVALKDEIENSEKSKFLILQESKYAAEKLINAEKAEMEKQRLVEEEKNKWKNIMLVSILVAVLVLIYLLYLAIKRLTIIRSKNDEIEHINEVLHIQKQGILDSINYAQRIQRAILPSNSSIKQILPQSFVFYKPKDVVAGDFYWLKQVNNITLIAVADCTGHGVPGAMTSVVCNNAINRAVLEFDITEPGNILDKTREMVLSEFGKEEEDIDEGMDIALCTITRPTNGNPILGYAGAYNPLWVIRNHEIIKLYADRQPVSKFSHYHPFTTQKMELNKGDMIYVFTDGFMDQFGGTKDRKFGSRQFEKLLLSIHSKDMELQKEMLNATFEEWIKQGRTEQIDDVCIMGIKL